MKRVTMTLVSIGVLAMAATASAELDWNHTTVSEGALFQIPGYAVDGTGLPMTSYEATNTEVKIYYYQEGDWAVGPEPGGPGETGVRDSVMIRKPNGNVFLDFEFGGNLSTAEWDAATQTWSDWNATSVTFRDPAAAIAPDGEPVMMGIDYDDRKTALLAYKNTSGNWTTSPIVTYSGSSGDTNNFVELTREGSIVRNGDGLAAVTQQRRTGQVDLHNGTYDAGSDTWSWTAEQIPNTDHGSIYQIGALAYYENRPFFAWVDSGEYNSSTKYRGALKLSYKDAQGAWQEMLLDDNGGDLLAPSANANFYLSDTNVSVESVENLMVVAYSVVEDRITEIDPETQEEVFVDYDAETRVTVIDMNSNTVMVDGQTIVDELGDDKNAYTQQRIDIDGLDFSVLHRGYDEGSNSRDTYVAFSQLGVLGDFDGNGAINGLDIPGFKDALADADAWLDANPGRPSANLIGDFDGNGVFNGLDIPGFKDALAGTAVPEPTTLTLLGLGLAAAIRRRRR